MAVSRARPDATARRARASVLYQGAVYTYNTLWFSTPFLLLNVVASVVYIFVARLDRPAAPQPLPLYPDPRRRGDLFLILGEQHHRTVPGRTSHPRWLVMPERGLYTGMVIVGAIGSGKTSACMYPYVEQLLAYRADDPAHKVAGLIPHRRYTLRLRTYPDHVCVVEDGTHTAPTL